MKSFTGVGRGLVIVLAIILLPGFVPLRVPIENAQDQELLGKWEAVPVPVQLPVLSADFVSADDGWAVGAEKMIHWDGINWIAQDAPIDWTPFTVKMIASGNIWVGGFKGELLHFNGKSWQMVSIAVPPDASIFDSAFLTPDLGWLVGGSGDPLGGVPTFASILKWDGERWATVTNPAKYPLHAVAVLSKTDAWAVGEMNEILHWDGEVWQPYHLLNHDDYFYNAISMVAADDGWIVGEGISSSQTQITASPGIILHWDGKEWKEFQKARYALYSISKVTAAFGWAAGGNNGNNRGGSLLLHWDGETWQEYPSPTELPLNFVWAQTANDGWLFAGGISPSTRSEGSAVFRYVVKPPIDPTSTTADMVVSTVTAAPTLLAPIARSTTAVQAESSNAFPLPVGAIVIITGIGLIVGIAVFAIRRRNKK